MLGLADIRDYLKGLGVIDADWTIGRYEAEKEKKCCVYMRTDYSDTVAAIGGSEATRTNVKRVQVIVHYNRNHRQTEEAAAALYEALRWNPRPTIGGVKVTYTDLKLLEPVDLGSDDNGIFERSIWIDYYYERKDG